MKLVKITALMLVAIFYTTFAGQNLDELKILVKEQNYNQAGKIADAAANEDAENWKTQLLVGDVFFELENYSKALNYYTIAEDLKSNVDTRIKLARVNSYLGNHDVALKQIEKLIKDEDDNVDAYLEQARMYIRAKKINEAKISITRAQKIEDSPKTNLAFADLNFEQGIYELAKNYLLKVIEKDEENIDARVKLATSYYWLAVRESDQDLYNELFKQSLLEWNNVSKLDTMNAKAYFEQGKILFLASQFADAARALNRYAYLRPEGTLGRWFLAQSLVELGLCDSAASHLEYVTANLDSVKTKAVLLSARCYYDSKNYASSLAKYTQVMSATDKPELDDSDMRRYGTSALFTGDTTRAITIYKEILAKFPDKSCALSNMAAKLMIAGKKYDDALYFANFYLNQAACNDTAITAQLKYVMGSAYLFTQKYNEAKTYLEEAIKQDSNQYAAYIYLADTYTNLADKKNAEALYQKAIEKVVADSSANQQIATQAFGKLAGNKLADKDYKGLEKVAKQWTETQAKVVFGWIYLAVSYQGNGDTGNACKFYKKALEIDPENPVAKQNKSNLGC